MPLGDVVTSEWTRWERRVQKRHSRDQGVVFIARERVVGLHNFSARMCFCAKKIWERRDWEAEQIR